MGSFPSVTGKKLIRALGKVGFEVARTKGSHHFLRHPDGRTTTVPVHGKDTLGPGLLNSILRDVDMTKEELARLL